MSSRQATHTKRQGGPSHTPARSAPADAPVRAAPPELEHRQILALQRTHGNRTVARMLAGAAAPSRRGAPVQRWIQKGARGEYTLPQAFNLFKQQQPDVYALAQEQVGPQKLPRMDDDAIKEFLRGPVEDGTKAYYVSSVFSELADEIHARQQRENFVPSGALDGAEVALQNVGVDLPKQVIVKEENGEIDMHPSGVINFTADGSYKRPDSGGPWRVGLVQTLLNAKRTVRLINETGVHSILIDVPAPHNDRRDKPPWYDRMWTRELDKPFGLFSISLDDRPGMRFPSIPNTSLLGSAGADLFKSWLMLRNEGTDGNTFLYEWSWKVSYDPNGQAELTGETDSTTGAGAVLDGPRATQDYQKQTASNPTWNLPTQTTYGNMKKNAKKLLTPGSAMMPVKTYGALRATAVSQLQQGDVAGALLTLQKIKAGLDAMDQKQGYWKSDNAKTQHFTPILTAIDDAIAKLGAL